MRKIGWQSSPNYGARPGDTPIDMLVLHYTGMRHRGEALARLCDAEAQVSAHYIIDEEGGILQLVAEEHRAWHAGLSSWRGQSDVNSRSIGIELVNPGHEFGYRPFPMPQMQALAELAQGIVTRWPVPARNIVGQSDVAPTRKMDPGELFDWRWLAAQGIGLWPSPKGESGDCARLLRDYGYQWDDQADLPAVVTAFQRHFRPENCDGQVDGETLSRLSGLFRRL